MTHPFAVNDRIHELLSVERGYKDMDTGDILMELDSSKPDATVTELTARGFKYRYDYPIPFGRAQWGLTCEGGECFEEGFHWWRKIA